uniref:RNA-directed DNA polymerase n=1 Tax=Phlebotomus papatasi TaxID=29031 RepID=A0A1B0DGB3_PHLPP
MARATEQDPELRKVKNLVESGARPQWELISAEPRQLKRFWGLFESLSVDRGVLVYRWEEGRPGNSWRLWVLPTACIEEVLEELHSSPSGGHFGIARTLDRLKEWFYLINGRAAVEGFCDRCDVCAARKGPGRRIKAPMWTMISGEPFERLATDILGPLPVTARGNRYVILFVDYFTKWPEAAAIPDQSAQTVAEALIEQVVSRFGVPREVHSDQGRNYESEVFKRTLEILGADKTRTTPLHPQSDGMLERLNRTMLYYLAKLVDDNQTNWDSLLPLFLLAYRSAVHKATGYSPAQMVLGRDVRLPLDLRCGRPPNGDPELPYVEGLRQRMCDIHQQGRRNLVASAGMAKDYYDRQHRLLTFLEGQDVWLYNPQRKKGRSPKLQSDWEGPYQVSQRINDVVYRIRKESRGRPRIVHVNRLAPYKGPEVDRDGQT